MLIHMSRMPIEEFVELGYLQEVNRQFFHPLGMALVVVRDTDTGDAQFEMYTTDDPEGIAFDSGEMDLGKAIHVEERRARIARTRMESLGFVIQPISEPIAE